jgi:hypothetical protein
MKPMKKTSLTLVLAPLLLLACGGEVTVAPVEDAGVDGAVAPVEARAVAVLSASNDLADMVRVTWEEPSAAVTGYRVLRDGVELARVGADVRKFEDRTARAATLLAPSAEATQGTERAGIKVTWLVMGEGAVVASHVYMVVAVYGERQASASEGKRGSRTGAVTGFEISRDDGKVLTVGPGEREWLDRDAPRATFELEAATAAGEPFASAVKVGLPAQPRLVTAPAARAYRVRPLARDLRGAESAPVTGVRGVGIANEVHLQWQRSADTTPTTFSDVPGVTGLAWYDRAAPSAVRHYRARTDSEWVEPAVSTSAPASGTRWKQLAAGNNKVCGIDHEGYAWCWISGTVHRYPLKYDQIDMESTDLVCARREADHTVDCWAFGQSYTGLDVAVSSLAVGMQFVCGLRESDRRIVCATPTGTNIFTNGLPNSAEAYTSIDAGPATVCAIRARDGELDCFWPRGQHPGLFTSMGPFTGLAFDSDFPEQACAWRALPGPFQCDGALSAAPALFASPMREVRPMRNDLWGVRAADGAVWSAEYGPLTRAGEAYHGLVGAPRWQGCALDAVDRLRCWGAPFQRVPPDETYTSTVGHAANMCGIRKSDGRIDCRSSGILPATLEVTAESYRNIAGDGQRIITLSATGGLRPLGFGGEPLPTLPAGTYASTTLDCALRANDGFPECWTAALRPTTPSVGFSSLVTLAYPHVACGIRRVDGKAQCWGAFGASPPLAEPLPDALEDLMLEPEGTQSLGASLCAVRRSDHRVVCASLYSPAIPPRQPFADEALRLAGSWSAGSTKCAIRRSDHTVVCVGDRPWSTTERFSEWQESTGCGLRENDGKHVCRGDIVPIR